MNCQADRYLFNSRYTFLAFIYFLVLLIVLYIELMNNVDVNINQR